MQAEENIYNIQSIIIFNFKTYTSCYKTNSAKNIKIKDWERKFLIVTIKVVPSEKKDGW